MTTHFEDFQKTFRLPKLVIYKNTSWTWSVRIKQAGLGAGVLSLNRPAETFAELTPNEGADCALMFQVIEKTIQKAFGAEKFHYLALMMKDFHVHYHVLPRYRQDQSFEGVIFPDQFEAKIPNLSPEIVPDEILYKIRDRLIENLVL